MLDWSLGSPRLVFFQACFKSVEFLVSLVLTRPFPDNVTTQTLLERHGWHVVAWPLTHLSSVPLEMTPSQLVAFDAVAVSSRNAVRALASYLRAYPESEVAGVRHHMPLYSAGAQAGLLARQLGFCRVTSTPVGLEALALCLMEAIRPDPTRRILYLSSVHCHEKSVKVLEDLARHYDMQIETIYRADARIEAEDAAPPVQKLQACEGILFYSARAAGLFLEAVTKRNWQGLFQLRAFAISEAVAARLRPFMRVDVAAEPSQQALLEALVARFGVSARSLEETVK